MPQVFKSHLVLSIQPKFYCFFSFRIDSLLEEVDLGSQVLAVDPIHISEDVTVPRRDSDVTAWVNVIFGCNERCTYCVVPNTRGREQSRDPDAIKVKVLIKIVCPNPSVKISSAYFTLIHLNVFNSLKHIANNQDQESSKHDKPSSPFALDLAHICDHEAASFSCKCLICKISFISKRLEY